MTCSARGDYVAVLGFDLIAACIYQGNRKSGRIFVKTLFWGRIVRFPPYELWPSSSMAIVPAAFLGLQMVVLVRTM